MNQQEALAEMQRIGLDVEAPDYDTHEVQRVSLIGAAKSKKNGAYHLREFRLRSGREVVVGFAQNWVTGEVVSFTVDQGDTVDQAEWEQVKKEQAALRQKAKAEAKKRAEETAKRAAEIWANLPDSGKAPYLFKKQVRGFGLRYSRDSVVVPVADINGELKGLQFISADGSKKFLTGTAKKACFHLIGNIKKRVGIAEGYATAASIHQATGIPVAVAFDAGNLEPVAQVIRQKHPEVEIVIFGDDDRETEGNPGRTKALAAAEAVNGRAVFPLVEEASHAQA